jgi:hypothetical protein
MKCRKKATAGQAGGQAGAVARKATTRVHIEGSALSGSIREPSAMRLLSVSWPMMDATEADRE